jgi:hypothetical protein
VSLGQWSAELAGQPAAAGGVVGVAAPKLCKVKGNQFFPEFEMRNFLNSIKWKNVRARKSAISCVPRATGAREFTRIQNIMFRYFEY